MQASNDNEKLATLLESTLNLAEKNQGEDEFGGISLPMHAPPLARSTTRYSTRSILVYQESNSSNVSQRFVLFSLKKIEAKRVTPFFTEWHRIFLPNG